MFTGLFFKKKAGVESLFRIGLGDAADYEERPAPVSQADAPDEQGKHLVYNVRGRPFIAQAPGKDGLPGAAAASASPAVETPRPVRTRSASPPRPLTPGYRTGSAIKMGQAQLAEEEYAALFRNNLLRSCWKPQLRNEEVQHILTLWERKLVEVMHRWTHPDTWIAYRLWKRRTWDLERLQFILTRARNSKERKAFGLWRATAKRLRSVSLSPRRRRALKTALALWRRRALMSRSVHAFRYSACFGQLKRRVAARIAEQEKNFRATAAFRPVTRECRRAFNQWSAMRRDRREKLVMVRVAFGLWQKRSVRRGMAAWTARMPAWRSARAVSARFLNATMYALFRRWSTDYRNCMRRLRASLAHWRGCGQGSALNKLKAVQRMHATLTRALGALHQRSSLKAFNTWAHESARRDAWRTRVGGVLATLGGSQLRKGFNGWASAVGARKRGHSAYARGGRHFASKELSSAFLSWRASASLLSRLSASLSSLRHTELRRALNTALDYAARRARMHATLAGALEALSGKGRRRAWNTWEHAAAVHAAAAAVASRALRSAERRALATWAAARVAAEEERMAKARVVSTVLGSRAAFARMAKNARVNRRLRGGMNGLRRRAVRSACNEWFGRAREEKEAKRWLAATANEFRGTGTRAAWFRLQAYVHHRAGLTRLAKKMAKQSESRALNTWFEWTWARLQLMRKLKSSAATMSTKGRAKRAAFSSWIDFARERLRLRASAASLGGNSAKRALNTWRTAADEAAHQQALLRRGTAAWAPEFRAFKAWSSRRADGASLGARAFSHMRNRHLSMGWNVWVHEMELALCKLTALSQLVNRRLVRALATWAAVAGDGAVARRSLTAYASKMRHARGVLKCLNSWIAMVHARRLMRVAVGSFSKRAIRQALNSWVESAAERTRLRSRCKAAVSALGGSKMLAAMRSWEAAAFEKKRLTTLAGRWQSPAFAAALRRWAARAEELAIMKLGAQGFRHGGLRTTTSTWRAFVAERADMRARLKRGFVRLVDSQRAMAFSTWLERVNEADPMARVALFFKERKLPMCWNAWREQSMLHVDLRRKAGRMRSPAARALRAWRESAAEKRAKLGRIQVALRRTSPEGRAKRAALGRWASQVAERALMHRAGAACFYRKARLALSTWMDAAAAAAARRARAATALARLSPQGRALTRALNSLHAAMEAHRLTLRATSGFRHAGNRAAMNKWVEHAAAARRARVALARGAHARVAACLRAWLDATLNRKASRAEAAAARMVHAPLGRAFTHWAVVVAEVNYRRKAMVQFFNAGASKALRSWKALSAERAIMGRGARAMFATSLRRGLTTWSAFARESALAKEQMLRAKSSLSGDVRGRALRTWASRLQEVDVRARALAHFMDAERSSAFASWVEETVRWLLLRKALSSLSAKELKRGLNGWREWKDERARKASAAKASARKLSAEGRAVMRAYNQMRHVALISAPLKTALVRLTKRQLVKACMSWRAWTDTRREMRRLGANLVSSPTVRALRTWRHHSELAKRRLARLEAQVRRMVGAPELRALRSWRAVTAKHMLLRRAGHGVMGSALFKGLKSWMQHCQQKAEKKKALAAQVYRFSPHGRAQLRSINSWRRHSAFARRKRAALAAIMGKGKKQALTTWRLQAADATARKHQLRSALRRLSPDGRAKSKVLNQLNGFLGVYYTFRRAAAAIHHRRARKCLNNWFFVVEQQFRIAEALHAVRHLSLVRALNQWKKAPPHPARKTLARLTNRDLSKCFNSWMGSWLTAVAMRRALTHYVLAGAARALRTWAARADSLRLLRAGAGALVSTALSRGLNSWCAFYDERIDQLERMATAHARMTGDSLSRCFLTWFHTAAVVREPEAKGKAVRHLANRCFSKGFLAWRAFAAEQRLQKRALGGLLHSGQRRGLNRWLAWYSDRFEWRQRVGATLQSLTSGRRRAFNTWKRQAELLLPLRIGLARLAGQQLVRALNLWTQRVDERMLMLRASAAVLHGPVARALNGWRSRVHARAHSRELTRRALRSTKPMGRAFVCWVHACQASRPGRRALLHWSLMQEVKFLRALEAIRDAKSLQRRAFGALFNRAAMSAVNTWHARTVEALQARERASAALRCLSPEGRALSRALGTWKARRELQRLMRRGAHALFNSSAVRALNRWSAATAAAKKKAALMSRAFNLVLVHALNSWRASASRLLSTPAVSKTRRRIVRDPLQLAFDTWDAALSSVRLARRAASHCLLRECAAALRSWEDYTESRYTMRRAGARMLGTLSLRGFNAWCEYAADKKEREDKVRATLRSLRSPLTKALNTWAMLLEAKGLRERSLLRMLNSQLHRGWATLKHCVRKRERKRRALAHFAGQVWVRAWHSWEDYLEQKRLMRRAGGALFNMAAHRAVRAWLIWISERRRQRQRLRSIGQALSSRSRFALNSWKAIVEERRLMRRGYARFAKSGVAAAMRSWLHFVETRSQKRVQTRAAMHALVSGLRKGWNRWSEVLATARLMRKATGPMIHSAKSRALNKWLQHADEALLRAQRIQSFHASMTSDVRKALNAWRDMWLGLHPAKRAVSHWRKEALARGWCSWCAHLVALLRKQTALNHLVYADMARALRSWKSLYDERLRMRAAFSRLFSREKTRALMRWRGSAAQRENMLRVMRGKLLIMAGDHRCIKALNSWRQALELRRLMLTAAAAVLNRQLKRAFNRMVSRTLRAEAVRRKVLTALTARTGRALRAWREAAAETDRRAIAAAHWRKHAAARAFNSWVASAEELALSKRGFAVWLNVGVAHGLNAWCAYMGVVAMMRRAAAAWHRQAETRVLNTLREHAAQRREWHRRVRGALTVMAGSNIKRALNTWRRNADRRRPLTRGAAHFLLRPQSRAFNQLRSQAAIRAGLCAKLTRMRHRRVGAALNTWLAQLHGFDRARGVGRRFWLKDQRRAMNSWKQWYAQRTHIKTLVRTFRAPKAKRALAQWRRTALVARGLPPPRSPKSAPVSPTAKRFIKSMTWREVCSWLTLIGIPVSRSPPTLLRSLKDGDIYIDLVHRISLAAHSPYYVRHNVAKCKETCGVYMMIQHFFDSELVISCIGCQKIDVMSLAAGKAREHLDLVESFKTILTAVRQAALPQVYAVPDD